LGAEKKLHDQKGNGKKKEKQERMPIFTGWQGAIPLGEREEERDTAVKEAEPKKIAKSVETAKGTIEIENYCSPEKLESMSIDDGICMFSRHDPERQKRALITVSKSDGGNVIVGAHGSKIVSYIGIHKPSERERWGKPNYPWLFELGAIEVSRNYRRLGLAEAMLKVAFDDPYYEDKIVLTTGFTWHWDLEETGLTKYQYHDLGAQLMGRYGFIEMATDEPNVAMDSANLFLVRVGKNVPFSRYQKFASLLFANEWEAMLRGW